MHITIVNIKKEDIDIIMDIIIKSKYKDILLETNNFEYIERALVNENYSNAFKDYAKFLSIVRPIYDPIGEWRYSTQVINIPIQEISDSDEKMVSIKKNLLGFLQLGLLKSITITFNYINTNVK